MKLFKRYLVLQLKRIGKALPSAILMTLLLTGCVFCAAFFLLRGLTGTEERQKVRIGLVGEVGDSYLGFGITALQSLDASRFTIDFVEQEEETAKAMLRSGELTAYVKIPNGFIDAAVRGENIPITYVMPSETVGISSTIIYEVMDSISILLTGSQNAIYGMQSVLVEEGLQEIYWQATDELYFRFIDFLLGRTSIYDLELLGVADQLSLEAYYFVGFFVLFLLLWGIVASTIFLKKDDSLPRLLASKGQKGQNQVTGEFLAYFTLMLACLLCVMLVILVVLNLTGITLPEWKGKGGLQLIFFFLKVVPMIALIVSMQQFLFEIASNMVNGILLQFIVMISLAYLSGCFYPITFFPQIIQKIRPLLPTGVAMNYAGKALLSKPMWLDILWVCIYFSLFFGLTIFARNRKMTTLRK